MASNSYGSINENFENGALEYPVQSNPQRNEAARYAGRVLYEGMPPQGSPQGNQQSSYQNRVLFGSQTYAPGAFNALAGQNSGQPPPNYQSIPRPYIVPSSTSVSLVSADSVSMSGSLAEGGAVNNACCAPMTHVRRTFCLMLLFDLILSFVLWVIYTQITNKNLINGLSEEVLHYSFGDSLFDTVLCSAWRFTPLLLAYALFRINSPWAIAMTTTGTSIFLLCKIFIFQKDVDNPNMFAYVVLLAALILSWVETWFLDFKVLPREQKEREQAQFIRQIWINDQMPLINNMRDIQRELPDDYYTPHHSDEDEEFKSLPGTRGHSRGHSRSGSADLNLSPKEREYLSRVKEAWKRALDIHNTERGWKKEKGVGQVEGIIYSQIFPGMPKVYRLTGLVRCSPHILYTELVLKVSATPQWSNTTLGVEVLQQITNNCDVIRHISAEAAGGLVSSRDFVSARLWSKTEEYYASVAVHVDHPQAPPTKHHVRGQNRLGLFVMLPVEGKPNECLLVMYVCTDLKGWLYPSVVDRAMSGVLMEYLKDIRKHIHSLRENAKSYQRS